VGAGALKLTVFGALIFGFIDFIGFSIVAAAETGTGAGDSKKEKSSDTQGSELFSEIDELISLASGIEPDSFEGNVGIERSLSAVVGGFGLDACVFVAMPFSKVELGECV
jgi:hypothetical protein